MVRDERLTCDDVVVEKETERTGGRFDAAIADLEAYLANRPDADDALAMSERLDQLRRMPRLH